MRNRFGLMLMAGALSVTGAAFAQTAPATQAASSVQAAPAAQAASGNLVFDVASVRPSPAPDQAAMLTGLMAGKLPNWVRIDGSRATFHYESLKDLIMYAYKMPRYEISGPEWLVADRFDIEARLPEGRCAGDVACAACGAVQAGDASRDERTAGAGVGDWQERAEAEGVCREARGV